MGTGAGAWRRWISTFVIVQLIGPLGRMVRHLPTAHPPLYIGVLAAGAPARGNE
jgi:hypothetical protein